MRERVLIAGGVALFLALFTYPFWHAAALGTQARQPELTLPAQGKECVAPIAYMREAHMRLLIDWREGVVRDNLRRVHAPNGKDFDASLERTCLECHTNRASQSSARTDFCDRCHNYAGVSRISCWDCHDNKSPQLAAARRNP